MGEKKFIFQAVDKINHRELSREPRRERYNKITLINYTTPNPRCEVEGGVGGEGGVGRRVGGEERVMRREW